MAKSGYKGIYRVKRSRKNTPGWQAKVAFKGELHQQFFADVNYGSTRAALRKAVKWRDDTEKMLGKPRTERQVIGLSRHNNTGVIGLNIGYKRSQRRGNLKTKVYVITWRPEPGVTRRTSVSIAKYGEKEALRRAIEIRQQAELEMYGATLPQPKPKPARKSRPPRQARSGRAK